jgi:hypothetical protein
MFCPINMKFILLLVIFLASCWLSLIPVWQGMEMLWIQDATSGNIEYFPILVKTGKQNPKFGVGFTNHLTPDSSIITVVDDNEIHAINRDLRSGISKKDFNYDYFKVINRQKDYIDVCLEVPTTHDSMRKGWYRIQDGRIHLQKYLIYGPGFAFFVALCVLLFGLIGVYFSDKIVRIWQNHRLEVTTA